eukprot:scaffold3998_cov232-Ochromonas_danica.AAC.8
MLASQSPPQAVTSSSSVGAVSSLPDPSLPESAVPVEASVVQPRQSFAFPPRNLSSQRPLVSSASSSQPRPMLASQSPPQAVTSSSSVGAVSSLPNPSLPESAVPVEASVVQPRQSSAFPPRRLR